MLHYDHIAALAAVIEEGSFLRAARKLHITQSAVSQRIRALETSYGAPVLIREDPLRTTPLGEKLITHIYKVQQLERELTGIEEGEAVQEYARIRIGVNDDSLSLWFFKACAPVLQKHHTTVDILVDNEEHTLELLRRGEVSGCISNQGRSIPGASSEELGSLHYLCMCTPEFAKTFFPKGLTREAVQKAPLAIFDAKDTLHERFLRAYLSVKKLEYPYHLVPSNEGILQATLSSAGYAMIPTTQAAPYVKKRALVDIGDGHTVQTKLYMHWILRQSAAQRKLHGALVDAAKRELR